MQVCYEMPRKKKKRIVVQSNRTVWHMCEDDILAVARDRGIQLTEEQLEDVAKYVEEGLSAVCNWFKVVEMALSEVVGEATWNGVRRL